MQVGVRADMDGMRRASRRELHALDQIRVGEPPRHREANLDSQGLRSALVVKGVVVAGLTGGANRTASACLRSRMALAASPGFDTCERSNLGRASTGVLVAGELRPPRLM